MYDADAPTCGPRGEGRNDQPPLLRFLRSSGEHDAVMIVFVSRLQDNHLISGIDNTQEGGDDSFGNAAGHRHMPLRINILAVEPAALLRDRPAQAWLPPRHSILITATPHHLFGRGDDFLGRIEIRETLGQ